MDASQSSQRTVDSLLRIHQALRRSLETIVTISAGKVTRNERVHFAHFCTHFSTLLTIHHDSEDEIIFPKIVEVSQRSALPEISDNVTSWRHEHSILMESLAEFNSATAQFLDTGESAVLHDAAVQVRELLLAHLSSEEAQLTEAAISKLLLPDELQQLEAASIKHGQRAGGPQTLMFLVHSLNGNEQHEHFKELPWLVRKILVKRIWARGYRHCRRYAYNKNISL